MSEIQWWQALLSVNNTLEDISADYTLIGSSALFAQGILPISRVDKLEISLQWDLMPLAYEALHADSGLETQASAKIFRVYYQDLEVVIIGYLNTVVVTDPDRLAIEHDHKKIWVKAPDSYEQTLAADNPDRQAIKLYMRQLQQQNSQLNQAAWNQVAYDAWVHRHGTPQAMAARIQKDPWTRLASLSKYLPVLQDKTIINLLGSHGSKAIAMALLGADVTIVDISQENAQYAREVAAAAGVKLRYLVADVLNLPIEEQTGSYDLVFMELGILHYFVDLTPLAQLVQQLLRPGGQLLLQDFHPVSTKLITSKGKKHKVDGNYFDKGLHTSNVAFSKHLPEGAQQAPQQVYLRQWGLGEIVTAFAAAGLFIRRLDEEPNSKIDDIGIPKTFTLLAERPLFQLDAQH
ncbi:hypothetical protein KDA_60880 [Dictyobacter alpinus]|uniref:Methyltransferase domain-containing protein n=1 Tax=Dictyobacter alpinus TaxID=2014873 RepID=A0A402BGQ5_9CHLR|nr:class I SAM-dependent methyltransferase [Dictyobacter alpinus]GCE30604.1 hypothetical protein KDA_60880 [Dictyobacter alpinus]